MNWLNYHHLFYFWTVAKEGSFTKAAQKLLIAQSAVSFQVSQLEDFLGQRLIERTTSKKLTLTEAGHNAFQRAEEIFRQGRELVDSVKGASAQLVVRIGTLGSLSKNLQVRVFKPIVESTKMELSVEIGDPNTLLSRLYAFHLDAILCEVPFPHAEDEPLIQREIAKEPICLVAREKPSSVRRSMPEILAKGIYLPSKSNPVTVEILEFLKSQDALSHIRGYIDDIALLRLLALETDSVVAIPRVGAERDFPAKNLFLVKQFKNLHERCYLVIRQTGDRAARLSHLLNLPRL
jgi:LysR family transcriptional activator of nhaA